jgi:hypothetical protein
MARRYNVQESLATLSRYSPGIPGHITKRLHVLVLHGGVHSSSQTISTILFLS